MNCSQPSFDQMQDIAASHVNLIIHSRSGRHTRTKYRHHRLLDPHSHPPRLMCCRYIPASLPWCTNSWQRTRFWKIPTRRRRWKCSVGEFSRMVKLIHSVSLSWAYRNGGSWVSVKIKGKEGMETRDFQVVRISSKLVAKWRSNVGEDLESLRFNYRMTLLKPWTW